MPGLSSQQAKLLEQVNPRFAERHVKSEYPDYLLCQGRPPVETFEFGKTRREERLKEDA